LVLAEEDLRHTKRTQPGAPSDRYPSEPSLDGCASSDRSQSVPTVRLALAYVSRLPALDQSSI
jgi:hypothetical protein